MHNKVKMHKHSANPSGITGALILRSRIIRLKSFAQPEKTTKIQYMLKNGLASRKQRLLDIGCGYGRDSFYLRKKLGCSITGIDTSWKAIEMANSSSAMTHGENVKFLSGNFMELEEKQYDILFASNFYQLLQSSERKQFRRKASEALKPDGLFFLSTLSVSDPEHFGKGTPHPLESNSFSGS